MRPALAIQLCLALFQAFLLAPVQHVHETADGKAGEEHEHATVIHSHFSPHSAFHAPARGVAITDDDGHAAWTLDTFTLELPVGLHPIVPAQAPDILYAPRIVVGVAVPVEERAHDPPGHSSALIPRAPPA